MKKLFRFLILTTLVCLGLCMGAAAEDLSGTFGVDNALAWTLEEATGTLTISGEGVIGTDSKFDLPWYNSRSLIKRAVIGDGVEDLPRHSFYDCENLETAHIGAACIGIYLQAFDQCPALQSITVSEGNPYFISVDGMLMIMGGRELCLYPTGRKGPAVLPESVAHIMPYAFADAAVTEITLGENVTQVDERAFENAALERLTLAGDKTIGNSAFFQCDSLTTVDFGQGNLTLGEAAFSSCMSLKEATFPAGLTSMGKHAFYKCCSLARVDLSAAALEEIPGSAFFGCSALVELKLPEGLVEIGSQAFYDCKALTGELYLPGTLDSIGVMAFGGWNPPTITDIVFGGSPKDWSDMKIQTDNNCLLSANLTCLKEDTAETDPDDTFTWETQADGTLKLLSCTSDNDLLIIPAEVDGKAVTAIGEGALADMTALTQVVIRGSLTSIGEEAFAGMSEDLRVSYLGNWGELDSLSIAGGNDILTAWHGSYNLGGVYDDALSRWAQPGKSFLYEDRGNFIRVEYIDGEVVVEAYDSGFDHCYTQLVEAELPLWGGFYAGETYNFLVFGQQNKGKLDSTEVLRVVKYSKDWERLDHVTIRGANTADPFNAGGMSMDEGAGLLYIRTSHQMYNGHQSNFTIVVDQAAMEVADIQDYTGYVDSGYVSHSMNQHILIDSENKVIALDHGDAYPRAACLFQYYDPAGNGQYHHIGQSVDVVSFPGELGDNTTGAYVTGLGETTTGYVSLYSSLWQPDGTEGAMDLYLAYTPKDAFTAEATVTRLVARDCGEGQLVPDGLGGGWILWENAAGTAMYYARYSADGAVTEPVEIDAWRSDCQPIVSDGKVIWYVTGGAEPVFYVLDETGVKAQGEQVERKVTFEVYSGTLNMYWDTLLESNTFFAYKVYAATEDGPWEYIGYRVWPNMQVAPAELMPGVYTRFRIDMVDSGMRTVLGRYVVENATLTVTGEERAASVRQVQVSETGRQLWITGLENGVEAALVMQGPTTIGTQTFTPKEGTAKVNIWNTEHYEGTYTLVQFADAFAEGETASYTRVCYAENIPVPALSDAAAGCNVHVKVTGSAEVTLNGETKSGESVTFEGVAAGTYDLTAKRGGCLTWTIQNIAVGAEDVDLGTITMVAGDVNSDGKINIADMGVFRQEFGKTGTDISNVYTDVNSDGKVNIADMGVFRQNFGKTAEKDCTVEYTA